MVTKNRFRMIDGTSVNVRDFGAVGDGIADDTAAIQAAFDYCYAQGQVDKEVQNLTIPDGKYRISSQITHRAFIQATHVGVLQPDAGNWDGSANIYEIYDDYQDKYDNGNATYVETQKTAILGVLRIDGDSVPAIGLNCLKGAGIIIQGVQIHGAQRGGIFIRSGYEWKVSNWNVTAPKDADDGAQGMYINTSDCMISKGASIFYSSGLVLDSSATANVIMDVHNWGWTSADLGGTVGRMWRGFEVHGGFNQFIGCYADSTSKRVAGSPPSPSNGGIAFWVTGFDNGFVGCKFLSHPVEGTHYGCGWWLNVANTSLTNCDYTNYAGVAPDYSIYLDTNADLATTYITGGNIGQFWLWDTQRQLTDNHGDIVWASRVAKYTVNDGVISGSILMDGTVNSTTGDYATDWEITLPSNVFGVANGSGRVNQIYPFRNALSSVTNPMQLDFSINNESGKFRMSTVTGGTQNVKTGDLPTGSLYLQIDFQAILDTRFVV